MFILGAPKVQIIRDGLFMEGGKIYTYEAGTSTPKATYPTWEDATNETNANTNPVILDARGEADIVLKGPTKVTVADAEDNILWSVDDLDTDSIDVFDIEGNALLTFTGVTNAVNNIEISNAALGGDVIIEAVGDDSNIGIEIKCKGTGEFQILSGDLEITAGNIIITAGNLEVSSGDVNIPNGTVNFTEGNFGPTSRFLLLTAGTMIYHAGSTAPSGWLECDGSAVSRTTYSSLFSAIGTTYGSGDGSTTFNLPNQARRTLVGKGGTGTATLANTIGSTGGAETHTLTIAEMPSHNHSILEQRTGLQQFPPGTRNNRTGALTDVVTTNNSGSGNPHNIMQPSLVNMLIIRAY